MQHRALHHAAITILAAASFIQLLHNSTLFNFFKTP
jgi:hypothetical protein